MFGVGTHLVEAVAVGFGCLLTFARKGQWLVHNSFCKADVPIPCVGLFPGQVAGLLLLCSHQKFHLSALQVSNDSNGRGISGCSFHAADGRAFRHRP